MKTCTKCNISKPLSAFWKNTKIKKDGTQSVRGYCIECGTKDRLKRYHEQNGKEKQKKRSFKNLMKQYGISVEYYEQERESQQFRCKICLAHENTQPHKRLYVDHCHTTGKYRGLLCQKCNTGLGMFQDSVESLNKAIEYINENSARHRNE